ncbi:M23 family metallopeptidase [Mucilaginibacter sp. X5P1]|uniref:M23 family metallopeptidase n=1 Tax=Mucilaginibacter sp. X5P1 TaxID=2723088 RepID=UPI0016230744|nr:M23 family metallopeptidase [Mucilaginibacter sp. X5P1]MBB6141703.1 murein DD-endopeptidase MepM/ murein hydrolase activator NlpD [Mucilaginibacter sp. X5P1]
MTRLMFLAWLVFLPLKHIYLTSPYGYRVHPVTGQYKFHAGIDLRASHDTVFAIMDGIVSGVDYNPLLGTYIRLDHGEYQSCYGHLSQVFVLPGDTVFAGNAIAITGSSGRVTGEHLHFSVSYHHQNINPLEFLYRLINQSQNYERKL